MVTSKEFRTRREINEWWSRLPGSYRESLEDHVGYSLDNAGHIIN